MGGLEMKFCYEALGKNKGGWELDLYKSYVALTFLKLYTFQWYISLFPFDIIDHICWKWSWLKRSRYILEHIQPTLKTFTWRSGRHINTFRAFSLDYVFTGIAFVTFRNLIFPQIKFCEINFCV